MQLQDDLLNSHILHIKGKDILKINHGKVSNLQPLSNVSSALTTKQAGTHW